MLLYERRLGGIARGQLYAAMEKGKRELYIRGIIHITPPEGEPTGFSIRPGPVARISCPETTYQTRFFTLQYRMRSGGGGEGSREPREDLLSEGLTHGVGLVHATADLFKRGGNLGSFSCGTAK